MKWILFLFAIGVYQCESKKLSRCELVTQLRQQGFPENKLRDWVCLVEHESARRTDVVSKKNKDGTRDYGLFQINEKWCSNTNKPGKECNVTCKQLLSDNISNSAACAKNIYQQRGFSAWFGWQKQCRGKTLPDISSCKK